MGKNVTLETMREDVRYRADMAATSLRLTDDQLDRLIALNLDRLMGVVSEAYGDDYFAFPVGIAVRRRAADAPPVRKIPFSAVSVSESGIDPANYWLSADGNPAPAFWKMRKVEFVDQGQIDGPPLRPVADSDFGTDDVIAIQSWTGSRRPVPRLTMRRVNSRDQPASPAYRLIGNDVLWLEADRDAISSFVIWFTGLPLDLTAPSDASLMLPSWTEWLVQATVAVIEQRDRRDPSTAIGLRDQAGQLIAEHARERDEWGPEVIGAFRGARSDAERFDDETLLGDF